MSVRGAGGSYPACTSSSARALASNSTRSRFIVIVSESDKNPSPPASCAEVATFAVAIVSKVFFMASIISTEPASASPEDLPRDATAVSTARSNISLQPPPPGSSPTPTSTNPVYSSACGCRAAACKEISVPPPRHSPNGADTTGLEENLMACVIPWNWRIARSTSSHSSSCTLMSSSMRLAPTEKLVASLVTTKASKPSPGPPGFRDCVIRLMMSAPSEFILLWNSMQATPSPRSTREAPEFFLTTPLDFFATVSDQTPAGTCTDSQLSVPSSQYLRPAGEVASSMYQDFCPEASSLSTLAGTGLLSFFMRATVASTPA